MFGVIVGRMKDKPVTVAELITALKKCPQDAEIQLYYDGDARLIPNAAFMQGDLVVLGEESDIYSKPDDVPFLFHLE